MFLSLNTRLRAPKTAALTAPAALLLACLNLAAPLPANAHGHRHHHRRADAARAFPPLDLSPVAVEKYDVSTETDPKLKAWKSKMHLEDGFVVESKRMIQPSDVTTREMFVLQITQSLEGGFDSVNMYDRGIASWGLMQWASHSGSLDHALLYIKTRMQQEGEGDRWDKLFTANGLDVQPGAGLTFYGVAPGMDLSKRRIALRGSATPGKFDAPTMIHWATVLGRAGCQMDVQRYEAEYAGKVVDGVLGARVDGVPYHLAAHRDGLTVQDLVAGDPYAAALVFVLWTNNPRHAWQYVDAAARDARSGACSDDPSLWPAGAFQAALLRQCAHSSFGNWQQRAALVEQRERQVRACTDLAELTPFERQYQQVLATRKEVHLDELAERPLPVFRAPEPAQLAAASKAAVSADAPKQSALDGALLEAQQGESLPQWLAGSPAEGSSHGLPPALSGGIDRLGTASAPSENAAAKIARPS